MPEPKLSPQHIRANGIEFAYLEQGEGPLLLCLHGFPDTAHSFTPLLTEFAAAGYRAVAPFMRGYAPSGLAPDGDYRMPALAADIPALIAALGERQAVVFGHDWGAAAAYAAAALYPECMSRLITAAVPHPRRFLFWPSLRQLRRSRYMAFLQRRGAPEQRIVAEDFRWLRDLIREWSPAWQMSEQDFAPLRDTLSQPEHLQAVLAYYRAMPASLLGTDNRRLLFQPITINTLVLHGAQDGCIGPEMFSGQEQFFTAGYQRITLADAGHFLHAEQPQRVAAEILAWLRT